MWERARLEPICFSTKLCVEIIFGILKDILRPIMKRSEVPLTNMQDIVTTWILLYNLCIVNNKKKIDTTGL